MSLRRTALVRRAELRRRTPMRRGVVARSTRMVRSVEAKRRRPTDTGPTAVQRRHVAERAGYLCEACGLALHNGDEWVRPHSFHHRQPRGRGGVNSLPNLLLLCGTGITGCHGRVESRRTEAYTAGWLVRTEADPAAEPVEVWCFPAKVLLTDDGRYLEAA
jgi:hypothetical protein